MGKIRSGIAATTIAISGGVAFAATASAQLPAGSPEGCVGMHSFQSGGGLVVTNCDSATHYAELEFGYYSSKGVQWSGGYNNPACWEAVPGNSTRFFSAGATSQELNQKPVNCRVPSLNGGKPIPNYEASRGGGLPKGSVGRPTPGDFAALVYTSDRVAAFH